MKKFPTKNSLNGSWKGTFAFLALFLMPLEICEARYNAPTRTYKPKTDSVTNGERAIQFRKGLRTSNIGGYLGYLGTAAIIAGAALKDERIIYGGAAALAIGLPTIGFGSLYMKSSIHSEATLSPNGFPWYFSALVAAGGYTYAMKQMDLELWAQAGGGLLVGVLTLTSWKKFNGFRNMLAKRHSEYTLTVTPRIYVARNSLSPGIDATWNF